MDAGAGAGNQVAEQRAPARVLVVEDQADVARPLVLALREQGYAVTWAGSGWQALELVRESLEALDDPIAAMLLDLGLPDVDGLDVCRHARRAGFDGAILITSARDSEIDRVVGLDHGADDYVTKPYRLAEVQARIRALLRRTARSCAAATSPAPSSPQTGPWAEVDRDARSAVVGGVDVALSRRECDVLRLLAAQPGHAVSRDVLLEGVWRSGELGSAKTLDVTVGRLRRRLAAAGAPAAVVAVRGVGYRLDRSDD